MILPLEEPSCFTPLKQHLPGGLEAIAVVNLITVPIVLVIFEFLSAGSCDEVVCTRGLDSSIYAHGLVHTVPLLVAPYIHRLLVVVLALNPEVGKVWPTRAGAFYIWMALTEAPA
jgi:hypothetical protein